MRHLLKPISTLLIALSLTLGTVAVASAQGEPDPTEIGLLCPDPLCPATACGIIPNSFCTKGTITILGNVFKTCTCKYVFP